MIFGDFSLFLMIFGDFSASPGPWDHENRIQRPESQCVPNIKIRFFESFNDS